MIKIIIFNILSIIVSFLIVFDWRSINFVLHFFLYIKLKKKINKYYCINILR